MKNHKKPARTDAGLDSPADSRSRWALLIPVFLALLAPVLRGTTERWSQGAVFLGIGLLALIAPPRTASPRGFLLALGGLMALCFTGFLPLSWFRYQEWKAPLEAGGIAFPSTLSPQPWLTGEGAIFCFGGILWVCWLTMQQWSTSERRFIARAFGLGAIAFSALAIALFVANVVPPIWSAPRGFGPFPNRNQTSNFIAVAGIVVIACAGQSWRERRKTWPVWLAGVGVIFAALIINYSRAGIILFLGGAVAWVAFCCAFAGSMKRFAIGSSAVLFLLSGFLLFGGETLHRFQTEFAEARGGWLGFRGLVSEDALRMVWTGPWCGVGLGNFAEIFPFFRTASANEFVILHPESDWLWLGVEMGWLGIVLVLFALGAISARVVPFTPGTDRRLRAAGFVAGLAFAVHGLVDVSGHRLGTAVPALLVLSLAVRPLERERPSRWARPLFRCAGLVVTLVGASWVIGSWRDRPLPGAVGVARAKAHASALMDANYFTKAYRAAARGLKWAPLDWNLYFTRALAAAWDGDFDSALADFRRVRLLVPGLAELPMAETRVWLEAEPAYAMEAFQETLKRAPTDQSAALFREVLAATDFDPDIQEPFRKAVRGNVPLEAVAVACLPQEQARITLVEMLAADPQLRSLDKSQKTALFQAWARVGDPAELTRAIESNPACLEAGWRVLAAQLVGQGKFQRACELAFQQLPAPPLPRASSVRQTIAELEGRVLVSPADFVSAYYLYAAQLGAGSSGDALTTLRRVTAQPAAPKHFHYLEARLAANRGAWAEAWRAIERWSG